MFKIQQRMKFLLLNILLKCINLIVFRFVNRNIIDVAAMDSHNLEPQEQNNRMRAYTQKLAQQWSRINDSSNVPTGKLQSY